MTDTVLRAYTDVTPGFLTEALRTHGWIDGASVVDASAETIGAGQMGECARFTLTFDREQDGVPRSLIGKFAARDPKAREFMASSGYRNEVCFYQHFAPRVSIRAPRCAHAAIDDEGWFTLLLEDCAPMRPGDQLRGCTPAQVEAAVLELVGLHAPFWDSKELETHACFTGARAHGPELLSGVLQSAAPGFLDRYRGALAADEVAFFERFGESAAAWLGAPAATRSLVHSDFRPDNLLFSDDADCPSVAAVDWQGFSAGCGLSDVSFLIGNALSPAERREHEKRLVRRYHEALVAAGVKDYSFESCWDDYARSMLSALLTTVLGAMYGLRTERGDRMFELMSSRHARQILDLGADRFLDG